MTSSKRHENAQRKNATRALVHTHTRTNKLAALE